MGERAADLTGADQSNLLARHGISSALRPLVETSRCVTMPHGPGISSGCYPLIVPERSSRTFGAGGAISSVGASSGESKFSLHQNRTWRSHVRARRSGPAAREFGQSMLQILSSVMDGNVTTKERRLVAPGRTRRCRKAWPVGPSIDLPPEQARGQIDQQQRALAPLVQERIELDEIERRRRARTRRAAPSPDAPRGSSRRRAPPCRRPGAMVGSRKSTSRLTCSIPSAARTRSMIRRIDSAKPSSSSRRMSTTSTPRALRSRRSSASIERMPKRCTCDGSIRARGSSPNRASKPGLAAQHRDRHAVHVARRARFSACCSPNGRRATGRTASARPRRRSARRR